MDLNIKKIFKYFAMLLLGFSLMFYGAVDLIVKEKTYHELTNEEIIIRAKKLGMVPLNEVFLKTIEENE